MTLQLSGNTRAFAGMYEGLGADLPGPTRFLIENGQWFYLPLLDLMRKLG